MAVAEISMDLVDILTKQYGIILVIVDCINRDITSFTSSDFIILKKGKKRVFRGNFSFYYCCLPFAVTEPVAGPLYFTLS